MTGIQKLMCVVALLFSLSGVSQKASSEHVEKVFEEIYSFNLHQADSLIAKYQGESNDPTWDLLQANVAWWHLLSGELEDEHWNEVFDTELKSTLAKTEDSDVLQDRFYSILVRAFRARHELMHDNYLSGLNQLNNCVDEITDSFDSEREYKSFLLTSGLYYYFMGKAYEEYFILRPYLIFYPDGDMAKGIDYLEQMAARDELFSRVEARYFLMRIYLDVEKDYKLALKYNELLLQEFPDNLFYQLLRLRIAKRAGDMDALKALKPAYKQHLNSRKDLSEAQRKYFSRIPSA